VIGTRKHEAIIGTYPTGLGPQGVAFDGSNVWISSTDGDLAVVGARLADDCGTASGAAFVYRYDGSTWALEKQLIPSTCADGDEYGTAVAVSGNRISVSARFGDDVCPRQSASTSIPRMLGKPTDQGAAFVFRYTGNDWVETEKLIARDGSRNALFGQSISIDGKTVAVGSEGKAYLFDLPSRF